MMIDNIIEDGLCPSLMYGRGLRAGVLLITLLSPLLLPLLPGLAYAQELSCPQNLIPTKQGTDGDDVIHGTNGDDIIFAGNGNEMVMT